MDELQACFSSLARRIANSRLKFFGILLAKHFRQQALKYLGNFEQMLRGTAPKGRRLPVSLEAWREGAAWPLAQAPGSKAVSHLHVNGLKPACSRGDNRNLSVYLNVFTLTASATQES